MNYTLQVVSRLSRYTDVLSLPHNGKRKRKMAAKIVLTDDALVILGSKLRPVEMEAFELLKQGQKMTSAVKKEHMVNIIVFLVKKLEWIVEEKSLSGAPIATNSLETPGSSGTTPEKSPESEEDTRKATPEKSPKSEEDTSKPTPEKTPTPVKNAVVPTVEKPFACTKCGKESDSAEELSKHGQTHTEEKPFKCPKCNITFSSADDGCKHAEAIIDLGMDYFRSQIKLDDAGTEKARNIKDKKTKGNLTSAKNVTKLSPKGEKTGEKKKDICRHLKAGKCKFGLRGKNSEGQCPFQHPQKCNKFLREVNGCTDRECKYLHPFVCKLPYSASGRCERVDCTFAHTRKNQSVKMPVTAEQNPNGASNAPWASSASSPWQSGQGSNYSENNNVAGFVSPQAFLELSRKVDQILQGLSGRA